MNHTQKIFSVRDSKGNHFNPPVFRNSIPEAERDFLVQTKNKDSMLGQFPEDFDLYLLGDFDTKTGKMNLLDAPQHLHNAAVLKG